MKSKKGKKGAKKGSKGKGKNSKKSNPRTQLSKEEQIAAKYEDLRKHLLLRPSPARTDQKSREHFFLHVLWNESLAEKILNKSIPPPTEVKVGIKNVRWRFLMFWCCVADLMFKKLTYDYYFPPIFIWWKETHPLNADL